MLCFNRMLNANKSRLFHFILNVQRVITMTTSYHVIIHTDIEIPMMPMTMSTFPT